MLLTDQTLYDKAFQKALESLSASRKKVAIEVGNTHERGGQVNTWLGGKQKWGDLGFGAPGGSSQYGGW